MMRNIQKRFACLPLALAFVLFGQNSWSRIDADDQAIIDAASCEELVREHKNYSAAERDVAEQIRQSGSSTAATNVLGIATLATIGFGFFAWDDNSDAQANLAELREIREAIAVAAKKKGCAL